MLCSLLGRNYRNALFKSEFAGIIDMDRKKGEDPMKKALHITVTIIIILIVSQFIVRIADATVQIDDDIGVLVVLLAVINAAIGGISYLVYRKYQSKK